MYAAATDFLSVSVKLKSQEKHVYGDNIFIQVKIIKRYWNKIENLKENNVTFSLKKITKRFE